MAQAAIISGADKTEPGPSWSGHFRVRLRACWVHKFLACVCVLQFCCIVDEKAYIFNQQKKLQRKNCKIAALQRKRKRDEYTDITALTIL